MSLARYPLAALILLAVLLLGLSIWPLQREGYAGVSASAPDYGLALTFSADSPVEVRTGVAEDLRLTTTVAPAAASTTLIVAGLESTCLRFDPPGDLIQTARTGGVQTWRWRLSAPDPAAGPCRVELLVRLRQADGRPGERLVWVRTFTVRGMTVAGLPAPAAQAIGLTGGVLGLLLLTVIELRRRADRRRTAAPSRRH